MSDNKIFIKEEINGIHYVKSEDILIDLEKIINSAERFAYKSINYSLVFRNWLLGKRIYEEELQGDKRAEYGKNLIKNLAQKFKSTYGKSFDFSSLYRYVKFYELFPNILDSVSPKSNLLSWTHYRTLLQVVDEEARVWYEKEAYNENWSVRTLQRNISSQYYYRLLKSQNKNLVKDEMKELIDKSQNDKLEFIKNPVIAEFLGMSEDNTYRESDLEKSIIVNLQKFIMELGKGYAFVAR